MDRIKTFLCRFLSYMAVQRTKLQLVGAACMFIAAKYEEIYPPDVAEFVYITDDTYNKKQVFYTIIDLNVTEIIKMTRLRKSIFSFLGFTDGTSCVEGFRV